MSPIPPLRSTPSRPPHRRPFPPLLLVTLLAFALLIFPSNAVTRNKASFVRGSDAVLPMKKHSLQAPYVESSLQNKYWDFGGDAIVDTNRHIRLTQDRPHQTGYLWSRLPINSDSYEIEFEFRIDGKAGITFGDGLALWLTDERAQPGPVFGNRNKFRGMGIFFDTYANSRHPYPFPRVMAMLGDGQIEYNGGLDGANQELGACSIDVRRTRVATKGRLTVVRDVYMELKLHYKEWDTWESCFKVENPQLPRNPFLGFTALTGDVSDDHDIVNVRSSQIVFKNRSMPELLAERRKHFPVDGSSSKSKSAKASSDPGKPYRMRNLFHGLYHWLIFLIKWGIIVSILAALVIFGLRYRKKMDVKRF